MFEPSYDTDHSGAAIASRGVSGSGVGIRCRVSGVGCLTPAYCLLPTAYCLLPIAYCLLPIAYCLLPTAHSRLYNSTLTNLEEATRVPLLIGGRGVVSAITAHAKSFA
jgi:hypothetical protein